MDGLPDTPLIPRVTQMAHAILSRCPLDGATVIDATAGNGVDTEFLARRVGGSGTVIAFDVQMEAIAATRRRLAAGGLEARVELHHRSHSEILDVLAPGCAIKAAMFNLGYLPGGDHSVKTGAETSVEALRATFDCLTPGGLISVIVYRGHPGGDVEAGAIERLIGGLARDRFQAVSYRPIATGEVPPPELFLITAR